MSTSYVSLHTMAHTVEGLQIVVQAEIAALQDGHVGREQTDQERLLHTMLVQILSHLTSAGAGLVLAAGVNEMSDESARFVLTTALAVDIHD